MSKPTTPKAEGEASTSVDVKLSSLDVERAVEEYNKEIFDLESDPGSDSGSDSDANASCPTQKEKIMEGLYRFGIDNIN